MIFYINLCLEIIFAEQIEKNYFVMPLLKIKGLLVIETI